MGRSIFDASPKVISGNPVVVKPAVPAPSAAPVKQNWVPPATNNNSGTAHATPPQANPQPDRVGPSPLAAGVPPLAGGFKPLPEIGKTVGLSPANTLGASPVPFDERPATYKEGDGVLGTCKDAALNNNPTIVKVKP